MAVKRADIIHSLHWMLIGLMAASLPLSKSTFMIFMVAMIFVLVVDGIEYHRYMQLYRTPGRLKRLVVFLPWHLKAGWISVSKKLVELPDKKLFFAFCLFYLVYIVGSLYSENRYMVLVELRGKLPLVLIPLLFLSVKNVSDKNKALVLLLFVGATLFSSWYGMYLFLTGSYSDIREISPYIQHISFSLFIAFSLFILFFHSWDGLFRSGPLKYIRLLTTLWLLFFLLFVLKSLTGVLVLFAGMLFVLCFPQRFKTGIHPAIGRSIAIALIAGGVIYTGIAIHNFYDIQPIHESQLTETTARGNIYFHDPEAGILENGHYVYYFIADAELMEAWNARSNVDYEGLDRAGHEIRYTIYHYLTSLGLRKDAEALSMLSDRDIENIENGISNHIFTRRFSLYPRIYQTIWEYHVYSVSGRFQEKSVIQRLVSVRIGMKIAARNLLFGVGTGDVVDHYYQIYNQMDDEKRPEKPITGANQWLNFIVAFGLFGFAIILFSMVYPAWVSGSFKKPLFLLFCLTIALAMLGEDTLRFQTGLTFFAFFYGFFVFLNPKRVATNNRKVEMKTIPQKVLAIQTAFIGDLIMTTPLFQGIRKAYPQATIDVVVNSRYLSLLNNNPHINHIYGFNKSKNKLRNLYKLILQIRKERYDLAISKQFHLSSSLMMFLGGIPVRVGSSKQLLLTHSVAFPAGIHIREEVGMLLQQLSDTSFDLQTRLYPSKEDHQAVQTYLRRGSRFRLGVAPGSVWNTKKWPADYYAETIRQIGKETDVYLIGGGADDVRLCENLMNDCPGIHIVNTAGRLSLLQSAALIGELDLMLCNDSAPLHMANAMNTPVYAIFGPTVKRFGCYPYQAHDKLIEIDLYCRPCGKHGGKSCPEGHFRCMKEILPEQVIGHIRSFMKNRNSANR